MKAFITSLMLTVLLVGLVVCLTSCKKRVYGGLEVMSHRHSNEAWATNNPTGVVGFEFDNLLDEYMADNFSVRLYGEHRSDPSTTDDGYGKNVGGGKLLYEF